MLGVLTTEEIEAVLRSEVIGRIGCRGNDRVYVVPITYAYDGEAVYAHAASAAVAGWPARAGVYGEILTTCATCHKGGC